MDIRTLGGRPSSTTPLGKKGSVTPRVRTISHGSYISLLVIIASFWIIPTYAAFVTFQNCLSPRTLQDQPLALQLVPQFVNVVFNSTNPDHNLNITAWVNVTGSTVGQAPKFILPPANDSDYWNSNDTQLGGKIEAIPLPDTINKETTLERKISFLNYQPHKEYVSFCDNLINRSCPLGPVLSLNTTHRKDFHDFASFGLSYNLYSSYALTSLVATLRIKYGDEKATEIGCISANITPDIGSKISGIIRIIPIFVLISVGIATLLAAIWSPWGTSNIFHWTTNYGQDTDLLRLVTPGFGDCLQYIQFIALTGGLTINYPGFYQPIISKLSWSALIFKQNFVNPAKSTSLIDGIYVTHGNYGMDKLSQLTGIAQVRHVWPGMAIWLFAIIAVSLALVMIGFFLQWANRKINKVYEEDLRAKKMPFTVGNVIRIVFSHFLLPIITLSMFQLAVAPQSSAYIVGLAVLMLILIIGLAAWLLDIIVSTRPKSYLFEDLRTILLYGSLYNTYSDHAVSFAPIPVILTFVRGVAIGAVQASGIVQLVLLAICEVITILTIHAFRPFYSLTSMNAYHIFFATIRFTTVLLMISFTPSLGVSEGSKGWIGYCILLMHAIVLVLGFLLNAIQTIVEVGARLAGAGHDGGHTRGGLVEVFGMRQLSKRLPRYDATSRQSQFSNVPMLDTEERKSYFMEGGKKRSQSVGSTGILLGRQSMAIESSWINPFEAAPPATASFGLRQNRTSISAGLDITEQADPYYRPPRIRRETLGNYSPGLKSRGSWTSDNLANKYSPVARSSTPEKVDEVISMSGKNSPTTQFPRLEESPRRSKADYTTREVDFYYGVRGPALNANVPSRRIKTGPVDPTGPVASASSWLKWLVGGKTKDKGKGFEVVRSSRMPPRMHDLGESMSASIPDSIPVATDDNQDKQIDPNNEDVGSSRNLNPTPTFKHENKAVVTSNLDISTNEASETSGKQNMPPAHLDLKFSGDFNEKSDRFPSTTESCITSARNEYEDVSDVPRVEITNPRLSGKGSGRHSPSTDMERQGSIQGRRQASGNLFLSQFPFERSNSRRRTSEVSTDLSEVACSQNTSMYDGISPGKDFGQNTSMGFVNQHQIHTINQTEPSSFLGSSAEVIDAPHSPVPPDDYHRP